MSAGGKTLAINERCDLPTQQVVHSKCDTTCPWERKSNHGPRVKRIWVVLQQLKPLSKPFDIAFPHRQSVLTGFKQHKFDCPGRRGDSDLVCNRERHRRDIFQAVERAPRCAGRTKAIHRNSFRKLACADAGQGIDLKSTPDSHVLRREPHSQVDGRLVHQHDSHVTIAEGRRPAVYVGAPGDDRTQHVVTG